MRKLSFGGSKRQTRHTYLAELLADGLPLRDKGSNTFRIRAEDGILLVLRVVVRVESGVADLGASRANRGRRTGVGGQSDQCSSLLLGLVLVLELPQIVAVVLDIGEESVSCFERCQRGARAVNRETRCSRALAK